jgi:hypothetical protein
MIVEFVGLTHEESTLVEHFRRSPNETKANIIVRVLSSLTAPSNRSPVRLSEPEFFDLGQGARLRVGEKLVLYLSEQAKRRNRPDAIAEVRPDGLFMDGRKINPSNGSVLQPAMRLVQEQKDHRNQKGEIISLSAWRQWHVVRDGKLLSMLELKDPALARKRGRATITLKDLGLED